MADTANNQPSPSQTDETAAYKSAIFKAWQELSEVQEQEKQILIKKARLKQSVDALWPLAFPDADTPPDINSMTLADAIRLLVQSCSGRYITIKEVRGKLEDIGFDLKKYANPLASIHTAAARMVASEELTWVDDDGKKLTAGPELKPVPSSEPNYAEVLGMLGENSAGEK